MAFRHEKTVSDSEAIVKVQQGEIDYFTHIVHRYSSRVHTYVSRRLYKKEEADDIVQRSFISLYKAIGRIDRERPLFVYLIQIVRNEIKMFYRNSKRFERLEENSFIESGEASTIGMDIDRLLDFLPPQQKKALSLLGEGYSYKEIAEMVKKPINTVRTLIRRGRLAIQRRYHHEQD